jgi:uncharacterized RDD family membrane protein YckC
MQIYLSRSGQRTGPYAIEEINRQLATGALNPSDLGWSESSPGWKPLLSFAGVIMPGGASSMATTTSIATPITWGLPEYAGFWIRALAFAIDTVVLAIFALFIAIWLKHSPPAAQSLTLSILLQTLLVLIYMPALWSSPMQATAGQRICVLRVIDAMSGGRITFARGLLRVFGMVISGAILGIGFVMAAFTERKLGLHDMIAGTCVVKDSPTGRWFSKARETF